MSYVCSKLADSVTGWALLFGEIAALLDRASEWFDGRGYR